MCKALFEHLSSGDFADFDLSQKVAVNRDWSLVRKNVVENFEKAGHEFLKRELFVDAEQSLVVELSGPSLLDQLVHGLVAPVAWRHI